jgi:hypothetical protein
VTLRVIDSLLEVIHQPMSLYGLTVTERDVAIWSVERLQALDFVAEVVADSSDPFVHLKVAKSLAWYTEREMDAAVVTRAKEIMDAIPRTLEFKLLAALSSEWDVWPAADGSYHPSELEVLRARNHQAVRSLAAELRAQCPDPIDAVDILEHVLSRMDEMETRPAPLNLWEMLAEQDVELVAGMSEVAVNRPTTFLAQQLGALLWSIRSTEQSRAIKLAMHVLDNGDLTLCRAISQWGRSCTNDLQSEDVLILERLLGHPDHVVTWNALESLTPLARFEPQLTVRLALNVEIDESSELADGVCAVLVESNTADPSLPASDDIAAMLDRLRTVPSIDGYYIKTILRIACRDHLTQVASMLIDRIRHTVSTRIAGFSPIPTQGLDKIFGRAVHDPAFADVLRTIREQVLDDDWQYTFWVPQLYAAVSGGFSPEALDVVNEWASENDPQRIRAASRLLRAGPSELVFEHPDIVGPLLERAYVLGAGVYEEVAENLAASVIGGTRQRTLGLEPVFAEDVAIVARSGQVMQGLNAGSPAYRFYAELKESAEGSMHRERMRDEEEFG